MQNKDEIIDWCVIFTVLLQVLTLPILFWDMGIYMMVTVDAFNAKDTLTLIEQIFNLPLVLEYMGADMNIQSMRFFQGMCSLP